jgi:REP element-mobilizing transposase RayT
MYHVMSRGIERGRIFLDEEDYANFRDRMAAGLARAGGKCLAWSLMPNHFHFLILRGGGPLSGLMHRVMTGYAINYNLRHGRAGHLFQNRYKAIICDLQEYLLELAPYIHLNPLRAGLVKDLAGLNGYKWCGHAAAVTGAADDILDRDELLMHFGDLEESAVENYCRVMTEKAADLRKRDLAGGGLRRSAGGERSVMKALRSGEESFFDPRILGRGDFVAAILKEANELPERGKKSGSEVLAEVERESGVAKDDILRHSRERGPARARAVYCYRCVTEAGATGRELARELGLSSGAVSKLVAKGSAIRKIGSSVPSIGRRLFWRRLS